MLTLKAWRADILIQAEQLEQLGRLLKLAKGQRYNGVVYDAAKVLLGCGHAGFHDQTPSSPMFSLEKSI